VPNLAAAASYGRPYYSNGYPYYGYGYGGYYPYYGYGYPYYPYYAGSGFGFYYGYPYGFGFSVSFGYPYWPYYGYPYYGSYGHCYPYVGYYYGYPYRYLNYYDCDFYDGYYVRFGYARSSYYVACSGYGSHGYDHHCHHHDCSSHGDHTYHVRDCPECYPSGYVTHDVEVPDEALQGTTEVESREIAPPAAGEAAAVQPTERPLEPKEAFLASLKPAQLSFVLGLDDFRKGNYEEATESLYSASLEDPESRLVKIFLATSLFSIGEHGYAAEYLRLGLDGWDAFPAYEWDVRGAYGVPGDFDRQLAALEEEVRMRPGDPDRLLVLGFIQTHSGQTEKAAGAFESLRALSTDPADQALASRYASELEERNGTFPREPSEAARLAADEEPSVRRFLASHSAADVPGLPIK
jgi:tetratricopeptide (TPR) repeat protein